MTNNAIRYTILIVGIGNIAIFSPSSFSADNNQLEQKIQQLQLQIDQLKLLVLKPKIETVDITTKKLSKRKRKTKTFGSSANNFTVGNTNVSIGGLVKMDFNLSDYSDGTKAAIPVGEDLFIPATIPVGGADGDVRFHASAKNSRINLQTLSKLQEGSIKTRFEYDFLASAQGNERVSNSYSLRVRHAYLDWNVDNKTSLLAGQTWTTFTNMKAKPETLILLGPAGLNLVRQEQIRYTRKLQQGSFQLALENPSTTLYKSSINPYDDNSRPDVILRYNGKAKNFNYTIAAMSRELKIQQGNTNAKAQGYGISASGKLKIANDDIRFVLNYGNALGRYLGLNSFRAGVITPTGDISLIDQWGMTLALRHIWSPKWRSNLAISLTDADNPIYVGDKTPSAYQSLQANLLYQAAPKFTVGGEYLYATKELENGKSTLTDDIGKLNRLQFSMKYAF